MSVEAEVAGHMRRPHRETLLRLAMRYRANPRSSGRRANSRDTRRWLRAFRDVTRVASDALEQGDRRLAIMVLLEVVALEDAIELTCVPVAPWEWIEVPLIDSRRVNRNNVRFAFGSTIRIQSDDYFDAPSS